jgi:hypothetical protein
LSESSTIAEIMNFIGATKKASIKPVSPIPAKPPDLFAFAGTLFALHLSPTVSKLSPEARAPWRDLHN